MHTRTGEIRLYAEWNKTNVLRARMLNNLRQSKVLVLNHVFNPTNLNYSIIKIIMILNSVQYR